MGAGPVAGSAGFDDPRVLLGDRLREGSLHQLLADNGQRMFGDGYFADLYAVSRWQAAAAGWMPLSGVPLDGADRDAELATGFGATAAAVRGHQGGGPAGWGDAEPGPVLDPPRCMTRWPSRTPRPSGRQRSARCCSVEANISTVIILEECL